MKSINFLLITTILMPLNTAYCSVNPTSEHIEINFEQMVSEESDPQVLERLLNDLNESYKKKAKELYNWFEELKKNLWNNKIHPSKYSIKLSELNKEMQISMDNIGKKYKEYAPLDEDRKKLQSELNNLSIKYSDNSKINLIREKYNERINEIIENEGKILENDSKYKDLKKNYRKQLELIENKINSEKQALLEKDESYIAEFSKYNEKLQILEKEKLSEQKRIKEDQNEYIELKIKYNNLLNKMYKKLGLIENNPEFSNYLILRFLDAVVRMPNNDDIIISCNLWEASSAIKKNIIKIQNFENNLLQNKNFEEIQKKIEFLKNYLPSKAFQEDKILAQKELKDTIPLQANYYPFKEMFDVKLIKLIKIRYEQTLNKNQIKNNSSTSSIMTLPGTRNNSEEFQYHKTDFEHQVK